MAATQADKLKEILEFMEGLARDNTFPRNVRETIQRAKEELLKKEEALDVKVTSAIYIIDDVVNDVNLPMHARSELWNLVSSLEGVKK
ncbi:MAG TPA: UPF0147 family protein [archaeon]|nr:UPF0147 family protein [archaeon]HLD80979.1 UPF0147 family protein [archaeon]